MALIQTIASTSDVVTLVLDDATGLVVGEHVTIFNTGYNKLDGVHVLTAVNLGTDTVQYEVNNQDDITTTNVTARGAVLSATVTWIDNDDVQEFLGIAVATANDTAFIGTCVEAANCFAYRRRYEAGYKDSPTAAPCPSAKMGTILYAASLYRERGSVDSFQSYDAMSMPQPALSMGRVLQLLAVGKPRVG